MRNFEEEDLINGKKPFRFAENISTSLSPENAGSWISVEKGIYLWRLIITSENAYGLSVFFNRFKLSRGSMLFLYDPGQDKILGGFDYRNNKEYGSLQTDIIPGDKIVIELQTTDRQGYGELEVGRVGCAFIDIFARKDGRHGLAGACNIDINCPEGKDWEVIKRSVVRIYIGTNREYCTGTLINSVNSDGTPYLLTANHCIKYPSDAQNSVFIFGYESPECNGADGSVALSLSGATVLATSDSLDFTLVRLSVKPPESYHPYYAGWSISSSPSPKAVTIHHPWGDVKKIAIDDDPILTQYQKVAPPSWLYTGSAPEAFWRVERWDAGTTEPGSSGAPLFNPLKQIVGNLTGGEAICALPINDYYSRFYKCWDYYPENNRRLAGWLDPDLTGIQSISGYDPYNPEQPVEFLERFQLYPNPNDGHFTVETDTLSMKGAVIRLFKTDGQLLGSYIPQSEKMAVFDLSWLESGVYILELRIGDLLTYRKIIIAK